MTYQSKSIVVISWDGETEPLSHILLDTVSSFDIFLIDYSGKDNLSKVINFKPTYYLSKKSECKGDLINNVSQYLIQHSIIDFKYAKFYRSFNCCLFIVFGLLSVKFLQTFEPISFQIYY